MKLAHNLLVKLLFLLIGLIICIPLTNAAIIIVAAENFYGSVAKQLGGKYVDVNSILNNPNQDPHLFSASPSTAKRLANANIIIANGADYDPWMDTLLNAQNNKDRIIIHVAELANVKSGSNPHIWYSPDIMALYAAELTSALIQVDKMHDSYYKGQLANFNRTNQQLLSRIKTIKQKTKGISVTATEPVFGYMAELLGFQIKGLSVQWEVMNDATPSPKEIKDYEDNLINKKVKLLFYNNQVIDPLTEQIKALAKQYGIPIIGVSETQPLHFKTYHQWMNAELDEIDLQLKK